MVLSRFQSNLAAVIGCCILAAIFACTSAQPEPAAEKLATTQKLAEYDVRHIFPLGDLVAQRAQQEPETPNWTWFTKRPAESRKQLLAQLNQYELVLNDDIFVRATIKDKWDKRFAFLHEEPTSVQMQLHETSQETPPTVRVKHAVREHGSQDRRDT